MFTFSLYAGLPLRCLNWAYVRQGSNSLGVWYAVGFDFRRFHTTSLPIFGVILGLLEASKMYKLF